MITVAPLPGWRALARLAGPAADPERLATPWLLPGQTGLWFSRSSWALAAIAASWASRHGRSPRVALPAYFCNATLDPLRATGAALEFVPVDRESNPIWSAVKAAPDLVMAVHTFGRAADLAAARAFADTHKALLIEDAAHVLRPENGIGGVGDYVLWSPHKLLPIPHGGLLAVAGEPVAPPSGAPQELGDWLIRRLIQKALPAALLPKAASRGMARFEDDPVNAPFPPTPRPHARTFQLLAGGMSVDEAARRRRATGRALVDVLAGWVGWQPFFDPATVTPYRLVMRAESPARAAELYAECRRRGVPVESWPDLPPEVKAAPERFGAAVELRHTLICFPVHQGLDAAELTARLR